MATTDLSIIIVNWNTRDLLRGCLASLPGAAAGLDHEIIVVDNASADGSPAMVRQEFPGARLIEAGANLGFARANNLALAQARGRTLLLLNPDTICPPLALTRLLQLADQNPGHGGFGPLLTTGDGEPTISSGSFPALRFHWLRLLTCLPLGRRWQRWTRFTHVPQREDPDHLVHYVAGACLLIPRPALEKVGLLDERFFLYFEETDWCLRAWRAGLPIRLCTSVEVIHLEGRAAEQVSQFSLAQFQCSYRQFMDKHAGRKTVLALRLGQFGEKALQSIWHALRFWSERHRRLACRHAYEARLQLRSHLDPVAPTAAPGSPRVP